MSLFDGLELNSPTVADSAAVAVSAPSSANEYISSDALQGAVVDGPQMKSTTEESADGAAEGLGRQGGIAGEQVDALGRLAMLDEELFSEPPPPPPTSTTEGITVEPAISAGAESDERLDGGAQASTSPMDTASPISAPASSRLPAGGVRKKKKKTMRVGYERSEEVDADSALPLTDAQTSGSMATASSVAKIDPVPDLNSAGGGVDPIGTAAQPLDLASLISEAVPVSPVLAPAETPGEGMALADVVPDGDSALIADAGGAVGAAGDPNSGLGAPSSIDTAVTLPASNAALPSVATAYADDPEADLDARLEACVHSNDAQIDRIHDDLSRQKEMLSRWTLRRKEARATNELKSEERRKLEEEQMEAAEAENYDLADEIDGRLGRISREIDSNEAMIRMAETERLRVCFARIDIAKGLAGVRREVQERIGQLASAMGGEADILEKELSRMREESDAGAEIESESQQADLEKYQTMLKVVEQQENEVQEKIHERTAPEEEKRSAIDSELASLREEERAILKALEEKLDVRRSQVLIEAAIVEITIEIALIAEKVIRRFFVCARAKCPSSCAITEVSSTPETLPNLYWLIKPCVI